MTASEVDCVCRYFATLPGAGAAYFALIWPQVGWAAVVGPSGGTPAFAHGAPFTVPYQTSPVEVTASPGRRLTIVRPPDVPPKMFPMSFSHPYVGTYLQTSPEAVVTKGHPPLTPEFEFRTF
jgi:hypothetical protein